MPDHTDAAPFLAPATTPPEPESPLHKSHATPPPTPGERAKRLETDGYDPKLGADMRRAAAKEPPYFPLDWSPFAATATAGVFLIGVLTSVRGSSCRSSCARGDAVG